MLKRLKFKIIVMCYKLRAKFRFYGFLNIFDTFGHKVVQTWFILQETWHITLFLIYYCVEVVRIKSYSHMLEINC